MITKKDINKYVAVNWVDPQTQNRVKIEDFMKEGLAKCECNGKIVFCGVLNSKQVIILEHDKCDGEIGDYTILPKTLITKVKFF